MPRTPKVVAVPDDEYQRMKDEVAARAVEYVVTGEAGIRDCVSRETIPTGGVVRLDPAVRGNVLLVRSGAVRLHEQAENAAGKE